MGRQGKQIADRERNNLMKTRWDQRIEVLTINKGSIAFRALGRAQAC
jgi:hypothetical protein